MIPRTQAGKVQIKATVAIALIAEKIDHEKSILIKNKNPKAEK